MNNILGNFCIIHKVYVYVHLSIWIQHGSLFSIFIYFLYLFCSHLWSKLFSPLNWVCPFFGSLGMQAGAFQWQKDWWYFTPVMILVMPALQPEGGHGLRSLFSWPCSFCPSTQDRCWQAFSWCVLYMDPSQCLTLFLLLQVLGSVLISTLQDTAFLTA